MTTSIDPSVDELLLLEEHQHHKPNFVFANIKPIGAERKMGQSSNVSSQCTSSIFQMKQSPLSSQRLIFPMDIDFVSKDIQENDNYSYSFEMPLSTSSTKSLTNNHFQSSSIEEPVIDHSFHNHSRRSPFDNYNQQRQISSSFIQQQFNPSISTRAQAAHLPSKTGSSFRAPQSHRFFIPHLSQLHSNNPFVTICQQTRPVQPPVTTVPMFTSPCQSTRERFQVNSIGRPILRTNHLSQVHSFKVRR